MRALISMVIMIGCLGSVGYANNVDLRLVRAHEKEGISPQLNDVAALLSRNLPFRGFEMLGRTRLPLPNRGQTVNLPERLQVHCSGSQERLTVLVQREQVTLLNAVVTLRTGVPVILGGFPDGRARLLLVLVATGTK